MAEDATLVLQRVSRGEPGAAEQLLPLVYEELRAIAAKRLQHEPPGGTLQPTSLVHEAFMRLVDQTRVDVRDRAHFLGLAAHVMRQVLIDHARQRARQKRGGGWRRITLSDAAAISRRRELDVLELDEVLTRLAALSPREARVVELRVFAGLTIDETAGVLGVSARTVDDDWAVAKAWLRHELTRDDA